MSIIFQALRNLIYLILSLPIGILYFTYVVAGLSVGFALSFTLIGIPLLVLVLYGSREILKWEALLVHRLLGVSISIAEVSQRPRMSSWEETKHRLTSSHYWRAMIFLILKLPLGIFSCSGGIVLTVTPLSFILQPVTYTFSDNYFITGKTDTIEEAVLSCVIGFILIPFCIQGIRKFAGFIGFITKSYIENIFNQ